MHSDSPAFQWKPLIEPTPRSAIDWPATQASRLARWVSESAVEIVTPGYNDPQEDVMKCGNPRCPDCYPLTSPGYANFSYSPNSVGDIQISLAADVMAEAIADVFKISPQDLGISTKNKEQSMSPVAQRVIADLQSLDDKEYSAISDEINRIQRRKKSAIEENLDGVARMALLDKSTPKLRPFVLSYFKDGRVNTVQGVEVGNSCVFPEGEETKEYRVYVFGRDYPVSGTKYTMKSLETILIDSGIPYTYVYTSKED